MRLFAVLLLSILVSSVLAGPSYKGCQTRTPGTSNPITTLVSAGATAVAQCQTYCQGQGQVIGNVGLGGEDVPFGDVDCRCNFVGTATIDTNCPNACPASATAAQGSHCGGTSHWSVYRLTCTGICDDPHFTGLDGSRYDYMANPDRVVALISDRTVQVNGRFVNRGGSGKTVIGQVGVRVCQDTVELLPNSSVVINNATVFDMKTPDTTAVIAPAFFVERLSVDAVRISAGNWRMSVVMNGKYLNIAGIVHLDNQDSFVNGVYGITGHPDHHLRKKDLCQPANEGGCELPGNWQDYELPVGADIFSTDWTYKQFDATHCTSLAKEAAKLQKLEVARLAASSSRR